MTKRTTRLAGGACLAPAVSRLQSFRSSNGSTGSCSSAKTARKKTSLFNLINNYTTNSSGIAEASAALESGHEDGAGSWGPEPGALERGSSIGSNGKHQNNENSDGGNSTLVGPNASAEEGDDADEDALETLYKHIRFLQRCSSDGRVCAGLDEDNERQGLHPGLFAKLPISYVTLGSLQPKPLLADTKSVAAAVAHKKRATLATGEADMDDWLAARCASCEKLLHDISAQVLLELPCGHHVHHECARIWFAAKKHCPVRGCGLFVETHATLEREQANDARAHHAREHADIDEALRCVLSQRNPTASVEYDGVAVDGATGSLRTCSGVLEVAMDAAGRIDFPGEIDAARVAKLFHSLYQGSVTVTSTVVPIRHACHMPRTLPSSSRHATAGSVSRVVPAPGPTRTTSCDEAAFAKLVAERSSAAAEAAAVAANSASRGAGRLSLAGFKHGFNKALHLFGRGGDPAPLLGEPCSCAVDAFTQVHSFTVKGGTLFQRSAFANAVHMASSSTAAARLRCVYEEDDAAAAPRKDADGFFPLPARVLYM